MPLLMRARYLGYGRARCGFVQPGSPQMLCRIITRHVDDDRCPAIYDFVPVRSFFSANVVSADDENLIRLPAIGQRNSYARGCRQAGCNAGNDLDLNRPLTQNINLSPAPPKIDGSPLFSRTTIFTVEANWTSKLLIWSWVILFCPHLFPTFTTRAYGETKARTSGETKASCRTTSARSRTRTALTVSKSGSPGPAPTR